MSILSDIPLFDCLPSDKKDTLSLFCQERFLQTDQILFEDGDDATAMYIVKSGLLKAYKNNAGKEQEVGFIYPEEMIWEMALFDTSLNVKRRMASVRAIEPSMIIVIMDYAILELSKKYPEIYAVIDAKIRERKRKNY